MSPSNILYLEDNRIERGLSRNLTRISIIEKCIRKRGKSETQRNIIESDVKDDN